MIRKISAEDSVQRFKEYALSNGAPEYHSGQLFDNLELAKHGLSNPLIVQSTEVVRQKRLTARYATLLLGTNSLVLNYQSEDFNTDNLFEELRSIATGGSLFTPRQFIVIHGINTLRPVVLEKLDRILTINPSGVLFILINDPQNKPVKATERIFNRSALIEFTPLKGDQLKNWISRELVNLGHLGGVEDRALEIIARTVSDNFTLDHLLKELSKLTLLVDPQQTITVNDLSQFTVYLADTNTFELLKAAAKREIPLLLKLIAQLASQGFHPLQLSALLSKSLRTTLANRRSTSKSTLDNGTVLLSKKFTLHPELNNTWILKNLKSCESAFSTAELDSALKQLAKLDLAIKGSRRDDFELLQEFMINLTVQT